MVFSRSITPFLMGVFIVMSPWLSAQEVSSTAYDLMLKALLDETVDQIDVKALSSQQNKVILLDARAWEEYAVSHLPSARYVGFDDFSLNRMNGVAKDAEIVVYCSVGYRSERIGEQLQAAGYSKVKNLYGGIFEWSNAGLPLHDPEGNSVKRLHAYDQVWSIWADGDQVEKVYSKDDP